jgi:hypothetical protein
MRLILTFAILLAACQSAPEAPAPVDPTTPDEQAAEPEAAANGSGIREAPEDPMAGTPPGAPAAFGEEPAVAAPTPAPPGECVGVIPVSPADAPSVGDQREDPTALGNTRPTWMLEDVQPNSCGFGKHYSLSEFEGPTLTVLLSAGCGYCLGQAAKLDELWWELKAAGHDVNIVIINQANQEERMSALLERTGLPILQDTEEVDAWANLAGAKDDFYYYLGGVLTAYYSSHGDAATNLSTEEGYDNARSVLLHLSGEEVALPMGGHSPNTHNHQH